MVGTRACSRDLRLYVHEDLGGHFAADDGVAKEVGHTTDSFCLLPSRDEGWQYYLKLHLVATDHCKRLGTVVLYNPAKDWIPWEDLPERNFWLE